MTGRAPGWASRGGCRRTSRRAGFTLVETVVAIVMVVVGVLALVGASAAVTRQMAVAREITLATAMGRARLEQLHGVSCASLVGGTASARGLTERWSVTARPGANPAADLRVLRDSVFLSGRGAGRVQVYVSMRSCA